MCKTVKDVVCGDGDGGLLQNVVPLQNTVLPKVRI